MYRIYFLLLVALIHFGVNWSTRSPCEFSGWELRFWKKANPSFHWFLCFFPTILPRCQLASLQASQKCSSWTILRDTSKDNILELIWSQYDKISFEIERNTKNPLAFWRGIFLGSFLQFTRFATSPGRLKRKGSTSTCLWTDSPGVHNCMDAIPQL